MICRKLQKRGNYQTTWSMFIPREATPCPSGGHLVPQEPLEKPDPMPEAVSFTVSKSWAGRQLRMRALASEAVSSRPPLRVQAVSSRAWPRQRSRLGGGMDSVSRNKGGREGLSGGLQHPCPVQEDLRKFFLLPNVVQNCCPDTL